MSVTLEGKSLSGSVNSTGENGISGSVGNTKPMSATAMPRGNDGISPEITVQAIANGHRVSIKDINGTNTFDVLNGVDGKTPVKGVDYFTAAEKSEMVQEVLSSLPVYNGEAVTV